MLHLVTGTPGAKKTAYCVFTADNLERQNFINVRKNKVIFEHNLELFEKFKDEFSYYAYDVGSGHELKTVIDVLPDDYFLFLKEDFDDLRPDDYFKKTTQYNEIVERINDIHGKQKFEFLQPVRTIYTNIKACKIPYTRALIYDWREAPDGSVFIVDEVQLVAPFLDKKSNDPIIMDLTIHRHRGFDFYFITQYPTLLHPTIKALIGVHYHLCVPFGLSTKVYQYGSCRDYPNTLVNKFNCEQKFGFKPPDRIFSLYKSTTINTHVKRVPKFFYAVGVFALVCFGFFIYQMTRDNAMIDSVSGKPHQQQPSQQDTQTAKSSTQNLSDTCRKAENVSKPECVQWFDDLSKNKSSVASSGQITQQVSYDPNDPYSFQPEAKINIVDYPRLTGCAKKPNGMLVGIDQQGNIMPKIKQSDCKKWLNGERLFDYTRSPVQVQNNAHTNNQVNTSDNIQQTAQRHISQEIEQANNYVEPQLQAKTITGANPL